MALTACRDCGTSVSTSASECPKCNCPAPGFKTHPTILGIKIFVGFVGTVFLVNLITALF